jgi:DNA polymerase III delta subunit
MKFDQSKNFYSHISGLKDQSIPRLLIVTGKDEQERKLRIEELENVLSSILPSFEKIRLQINENKDIGNLEEEVFSPSFFYAYKLLLVKTNEKNLASIEKSFKDLPDSILLVLSLETASTRFIKLVDPIALILEIKEEKPWQQKERLIQAVAGYFKQEGKRIAQPLVQEIIEMVGLDEGTLLRFAENIICYVAEEESIEEPHLRACLKTKAKLTSWQVIDLILLGEKVDSTRILEDSWDLIGLIAQLRFKIQQILRWKTGSEEGYPAQRSKYLAIYGKIQAGFFTDLFAFLFELELSVKNGLNDHPYLFDFIQTKVQHLLMTSQPHSR